MAGNSTKLSIAERLTCLKIAVVRREPLRPKIQRVAQHLHHDAMHYEKHYVPKLIVKCAHWPIKEEDMMNSPPTHLLDLQRSVILYDPCLSKRLKPLCQDADIVTYRNIMDLKAAGVELKSSKTRRPRDICFSVGWLRSKLTLPEIVVDDTTASLALNLIAYEMCPDFENDYGICAYFSFLNSLINHPDDVKALRSERILLNSSGSDEEVVNLFKTVSSNLVPNMGKYSHVGVEMMNHCLHKTLPTWFALAYNTYFSNPWAIIALLAAVLGLALTFIQTWFTIHPPK